MKSTCIVTYDVSDNKRRQKLYVFLRGYAEHIQKSVFFCNLTKEHFIEMQKGIAQIIDPDCDQVLIVPCQIRSHIMALGKKLVDVEELLYFI